jgi:hypothetical protein
VAKQSTESDSPKVVIRTVSSRSQADILCNVLAGAGIKAYVMSDDCGTLDPALSFVRGVHLLVVEADAERATALLDEPHERAGAQLDTAETPTNRARDDR